jgi:hypothetical protein
MLSKLKALGSIPSTKNKRLYDVVLNRKLTDPCFRSMFPNMPSKCTYLFRGIGV